MKRDENGWPDYSEGAPVYSAGTYEGPTAGKDDNDGAEQRRQSMPLSVRSVDGNPTLFIAEFHGREVGRMAITVLPLVHDMEIPTSPIQRKIADALFFYASGKLNAAKFSEAVVIVADGNEAMKQYVESRGAIAEEKSQVYMMAVL